ncbi:T9SS type A sorting domain-containing protein [Taibaiella soli]|uniref:C-type lectin domain-containing protein n=1 Tax=Taibaiella soli TaxID=1649169 RepID=A0A2W2A6X7_9BACT|nr:T9SS type A sorting domain-containing protein [Taibaiella soli]PZF71065.1 hypothetical protein DN068_20420 [Taibaiella soli]
MTQVFTKLIAAAALATATFAANAQSATAPIKGNATALQVAASATTAYKVDTTIALDASTTYTGATVSITGFQSGDVLGYTAINGITGSYNATTGVLTFSGSSAAINYQNILRSVTLTSAATSGSKSVAFTIGSALTFSGNGHYYQYVAGAKTWGAAKYSADTMRLYGMHGYLATATSQAENDFIKAKLQADAWMGASDDVAQINAATGTATYNNQNGSEANWYWVTGPEKGTFVSSTDYGKHQNFYNYGTVAPVAQGNSFMNWNTNQPDNYQGGNTKGENSGAISATNGKWSDMDSSNTLGFVVEFGGMTGDPSVSLTFTRTVQYSVAMGNTAKPLGLTWVSFTASAVNENTELTWATADEKNTATFEIEHSTDGASFENIGTIAAKGTGNNTYEFTDNNTANGANYYRLKQVDNDGSFQYSKVIKLNIGKEVAAASVNFYPNPAKDVLNIATTGNVTVAIFNMNGVNVATQEVNGNGQIATSNLTEGMYICRVANTNGVLQTSKIQIIK